MPLDSGPTAARWNEAKPVVGICARTHALDPSECAGYRSAHGWCRAVIIGWMETERWTG
jgi:hypothetical protein